MPPPSLAADDADHAGAADAGHDLVAAEALELLGHDARGAVHVEQQLRMGVDVLPPGGDFRKKIGDAIDDRHGTAPWSASGARKRIFPARIRQQIEAAREVNRREAHLADGADGSGFGLESGPLWPRCASGSA